MSIKTEPHGLFRFIQVSRSHKVQNDSRKTNNESINDLLPNQFESSLEIKTSIFYIHHFPFFKVDSAADTLLSNQTDLNCTDCAERKDLSRDKPDYCAEVGDSTVAPVDLGVCKHLIQASVVHGVMVSHCEEDLLCIRAAYLKLTGTSLYTALQVGHACRRHLFTCKRCAEAPPSAITSGCDLPPTEAVQRGAPAGSAGRLPIRGLNTSCTSFGTILSSSVKHFLQNPSVLVQNKLCFL